MRTSFVSQLMDLAAKDPNVILLTGDLGFGTFEVFWQNFPNQFFNIGIAEQNMIGVASGLALSGKKVFVYSIGNFPTLRCLEQIRNDLCYHNLSVVIVSQGGGFNYGGLGMSHHATEDLSIMRALPNINVVAPSRAYDVPAFMRWMLDLGGPSYLRLEKCTEDKFPGVDIIPGKVRQLITPQGEASVAVFSIGGITSVAKEAVELLNQQGVKCMLVEVHTLKPFDSVAVLCIADKVAQLITVEENNIYGGLYSAVCEVVAASDARSRVHAVALNDCYSSVVGDQEFLRNYYNMGCLSIVRKARAAVGLSA